MEKFYIFLKLKIFFTTLACISAAQTEYGNLIGRFEDGPVVHNVQGTVYAVDDRTLHIRGFSYDGTAPAAVFYTGTSDQPGSVGTTIPNEVGSTDKLRQYQDEDLTITLAQGKITDYKWISVWCTSVSANFGHVTITPSFVPPATISLGSMGFSPRVHNVYADNVVVLNTRQIRFERLDYDGNGPAAYFWTGSGQPDSNDRRIPHPAHQPNAILNSFSGETVTVTLPEGLSIRNNDFIGIWCEEAKQDFGHVAYIRSDLANIPPYIASGEFCQVLVPNRFHIYWNINQASNKITLEFRGVISENEYLAFGISGSSSSTSMLGSDVSVVYFDSNTTPQAEDYHLNDYSQCFPETGVGACPDNIQGGANDVTLISGKKEHGVTIIEMERPLISADPLDKDFSIFGNVYVSWGIGFINPTGHVAKHDIKTNGNLAINFGVPSSPCPYMGVDDDPGQILPWQIEPLRQEGNATFVAVIGPSGGQRGYQGISEQVGWGLAWYINGVLIPEIHVKRGNTYTFMVYGGDDRIKVGAYHPFYITNDKDGGYMQKTEADKELETIYAAPVEGTLCEYDIGNHKPEAFNNFLSYKSTLRLDCPGHATPGILTWTVADNTPDTVYYQCYQHRFFGWKIHVSSAAITTQISLAIVLIIVVINFPFLK